MDNNSQFQLRESSMVTSGLPSIDPVGTSGSGSDDNTTTTTTTTNTDSGDGGTDTGNGATVTTPTNIKDEPTPSILEPIPEKPETGYEKAERYANLSIRWAIVLVMLALTYNLVKQYKVPKPTAPTA